MIKPIKPIAHCDEICATIDTIEVFFPRVLTREQYQAISRYGRLKPCFDADGRQRGNLFIRNRPDRLTLQRLDPLARECSGVLSRLDIALDIQPPPGVTVEHLKSWIIRTGVLKWRRKQPMHDMENGTYWIMTSGRRATRNLCICVAGYNRVTGELDCVHLELRFFRSQTIGRQGILSIKDVINLNPNRLFAKHVKFTDIGDMHVIKVMRQAVKDDKGRCRNKETTKFDDQYRASIPRRAKGLLKRLGYDRSQ
jgi:hypothetical protein